MESPFFRDLGKYSAWVESIGADFFCEESGIACQRKTCSDLVSSVISGHLGVQLKQMRSSADITQPVLIVEGVWTWTPDGAWVDPGRRNGQTAFSFDQYIGILASVQMKGTWVIQCRDKAETKRAVLELDRWGRKKDHQSLDRRPKPSGARPVLVTDAEWNDIRNREFRSHLLQSFTGISVEIAERLATQFENPLQWTMTYEELIATPGIGPGRAKALWTALGGTVPEKKKRKKELANVSD